MQPGSLRELMALFSIIAKNSSIRSSFISAWTMTENGLADMLRAVLENDNALVVVVEAELSNDDDRTALLLVVNA
jgi:hypothetical protein